MSPPLKGGGGSTQLGVVGGRAGDTIGDSESRFTHRVRLSRLTRLARQIMMMKGNPRAMRCTSSLPPVCRASPYVFHPIAPCLIQRLGYLRESAAICALQDDVSSFLYHARSMFAWWYTSLVGHRFDAVRKHWRALAVIYWRTLAVMYHNIKAI
jgi:hypothetical protein